MWVQRHFQDGASVGLRPGQKTGWSEHSLQSKQPEEGVDGLVEVLGSGILVPGLCY